MNKFIICFFLFITIGLCSIKSTDAADVTTTVFYVSPTPITDYNPIKCGNNLESPCNSIRDAVNSFLNQTLDTTTSFVINLLPGTYFKDSNSYGCNDSISLDGLNLVIQSSDQDNQAILSSKYRYTSNRLSLFYIFSLEDDSTTTTNSYSISFNNIIFDHITSTIFNTNTKKTVAVKFDGCTFRNSNTFDHTSLFIFDSSTLEFNNCKFVELKISTPTLISLYSATFILSNSKIYNGSFYNLLDSHYSNVIITNSLINNNIADNNSPLFSLDKGSFILNGVSITNNIANIIIDSSSLEISINDSEFLSNRATLNTLYIHKSNLLVRDTEFSNNIVNNGTLNSYLSNTTIENCVFDNNQGNFGSAIYQTKNSIKIIDSTLIGNFETTNWSYFPISSLLYFLDTQATITTSSISSGEEELGKNALISCHGSTIFDNNSTISKKEKKDIVVNCGDKCEIINMNKDQDDHTDFFCGAEEISKAQVAIIVVVILIGVSVPTAIGALLIVRSVRNYRKLHKKQEFEAIVLNDRQ